MEIYSRRMEDYALKLRLLSESGLSYGIVVTPD